MPKQVVVNKFNTGVNSDINEASLPNTFMRAGENVIIAKEGNQLILQKAGGIKEVINGYNDDLYPLAAKAFNDVIYMVSSKYDTNTHKWVAEYGTYPSLDTGSGLLISQPGTATIQKLAQPDISFISSTYTIPNTASADYEVKVINNGTYTVRFEVIHDTYQRSVKDIDAFNRTLEIDPGDTKTIKGKACAATAAQFNIQLIVKAIKFGTEFTDIVNPYVIDEATVTNNYDYKHWVLYKVEALNVTLSDWDTFGDPATELHPGTSVNLLVMTPGTDYYASMFLANEYGETVVTRTVTVTTASTGEYVKFMAGTTLVAQFYVSVWSDGNNDYLNVKEYYLRDGYGYHCYGIAPEQEASEDFFIDYQADSAACSHGPRKVDNYDPPVIFNVTAQSGYFKPDYVARMNIFPYNNEIYYVSASANVTVANPQPLHESNINILSNKSSPIDSFTVVLSGIPTTTSMSFDGFYETTNKFDIVDAYGPIINYASSYSPLAGSYDKPFVTPDFGYTRDTNLSLELQQTYDGTVNMITADGVNPTRIVNTRTLFTPDSQGYGTLVIRDGGSLSNVYCPETLDGTRLIPFLGDMIVDLKFEGIIPNFGSLKGGGYRYFFKLVTADGTETNVVEESRLVSVHDNKTFGSSYSLLNNESTTNAVKFTISGITNKAFRFVSVYYTISTGSTDTPTTSLYKIEHNYDIDIESGTCKISHTGYEPITQLDMAEVSLEYSPIETAETITQKNNRLLQANTVVKNTRNDKLLEAALNCFIADTTEVLTYADSIAYADPKNIYYNVGYLPGETYEIGINFIFDSGVVSQTYPIQGIDFTRVSATGEAAYDKELFGSYSETFDPTTGQNSKGVVRTKDIATLDSIVEYGAIEMYTMTIDTSRLANFSLKDMGITGYFISRKQRQPDMLMEGLLTNTAAVTNSSASLDETGIFASGRYRGLHYDDSKRAKVYIPAPMCAVPYTTEGTEDEGDVPYETVVLGPARAQNTNSKFVFYSPNIITNVATMAALFSSNTTHGLQVDITSVADVSYKINARKTISYDSDMGYGEVPYYIGFNYNKSVPYQWVSQGTRSFSGITFEFQADSVRAFTDGGFTSRSDRQLGLYAGLFSNDSMRWKGKNRIGTNLLGFDPTTLKSLNEGTTPVYDYTRLLMNNVAYSPYIGVTIDPIKAEILNNILQFSEALEPYASFVKSDEFRTIQDVADNNTLGLLAKVYSSPYGSKLTASDWVKKYSSGSSGNYVAISKRYSINTLFGPGEEEKLIGGDQYGGWYYQQVWRQGGIDGIPTATSPASYKEDRSGTGIVDTGMVIGFPVKTDVNYYIRGQEFGDVIEKNMYKTRRKYATKDNALEMHGTRRPEPQVINYGNIRQISITAKSPYDPTVPYTKLVQENRIYISNANITSAFENGYRQFKGINFKDYDSELGPITALVSHGVLTYIIYKSGVSSIEILERAAMQMKDGSNVYIDNARLLPEKSSNIIPFLGSQHKHSVISTDYGVTGVDANKQRIWLIKQNAPSIISEGVVQNIINPWFDSTLIDIITSYDKIAKETTYTFEYKISGSERGYRSIIYNNKLELWYGESFTSPMYQLIINNKKFALRKHFEGSYALFEPISKSYAMEESFEGNRRLYGAYFDFVVKQDSFNDFTLDNLIMIGEGIPNKIIITPEELEAYEIEGALQCGGQQKAILCHTNTFFLLQEGTSNVAFDLTDNYAIEVYMPPTTRMLVIGDLISLKTSSHCVEGYSLYQHIVTDVKRIGTDRYKVTLDRRLYNAGTLEQVFYGWKTPIRLSLMESYRGTTKLAIPTKMHAEALRDIRTAQSVARTKQLSARPGGKYVTIRMYFDGMDKMEIDSIQSVINAIYS